MASALSRQPSAPNPQPLQHLSTSALQRPELQPQTLQHLSTPALQSQTLPRLRASAPNPAPPSASAPNPPAPAAAAPTPSHPHPVRSASVFSASVSHARLVSSADVARSVAALSPDWFARSS